MLEILNTPVPEFLGMSREWTDAVTAVYSAPVATAHELTTTIYGIEMEVYSDTGALLIFSDGGVTGANTVVKVPVPVGAKSLRFRTKVRNDFDLSDYRIRLGITCNSGGANNFFTKFVDWDKAKLRAMFFDYPDKLTSVPEKVSPNIWALKFIGATVLNDPNISKWDTSEFKTFDFMFAFATAFNQPLNSWNTVNVTNMDYMFTGCSKFNQTLSNWKVSKVTTLANMFSSCTIYNQNLSGLIFKSTANRTNYDTGTNAWAANWKPKFTG